MRLSALSIFLAALATVPAPSEGGETSAVVVRIEPERAVIENPFLSIEMSAASKKLRTLSIANRITGAATSFEGNDFVLVFAGGRTLKESDFSLERTLEEGAGGGGKRLAFDLAGGDLRLRLIIEMLPDKPWAERWLEIQGKEGRLEKVSLAEWRAQGTYGPPGPGKTVEGLGYPQGYGQAAYVDDLFFAIEHPGAENFGRGKRIACRIPAFDELGPGKTVATRRFVTGAGEAGGALQAFLRFIGERRANPPRMVFLASDRICIDPSLLGLGGEPLEAGARGGRLGRSLQIGPAVAGEKLCFAAPGAKKRAIEHLSARDSDPIDLIEVDGFRPDCKIEGHGHPLGPDSAVAQMDALIDVFAAWRKARPGLLIAFTGGSNPSPFWLEHADFLGAGGAVEEPAGEGDPLERSATSIDVSLQIHRPTDMPFSAFASRGPASTLLAGASDGAFERSAWWLAARTSLLQVWDLRAEDLPPERWKVLGAAARWGKSKEKLFRLSRMVGSDPRQGGIYGFSAFEAGAGVLALRNPKAMPGTLELALSRLLVLPRSAAKKSYRLTGVFGETKALEGVREGSARLKVDLPPFAVAIFEVTE